MNKDPQNRRSRDLALSLSQFPSGMAPLPESQADKLSTGRGVGWAVPTIQLLLVVCLLLPAGAICVGLTMLLRLPKLPDCSSSFWPTASASKRLYCGEVAAKKQTVDGFVKAISLVKELPEDHPLHSQIDKSMEQWATEILKMGDGLYNAGKLSEAIATVRKVPAHTTTYKLVQDRIKEWESTWAEAEGTYKGAEDLMRRGQWSQAFGMALKLLRVSNTYWKTTKYAEINHLIQTARVDSEKLLRARELYETGRVDNLLAAIAIAQKVAKDSYLYSQAQKAVRKYGQKMMTLAEEQLEKQNYYEALAIARKIPPSASLTRETEDFIILASAQHSAWEGNIPSIESAIRQAQKVDISHPRYARAQQLIAGWQREIEDISRLEKARELAGLGTVSDLLAATAEAGSIPIANPRYKEAQQKIKQWKREIEIIEDRPYLRRAEKLASNGDVGSMLAAIGKAKQINYGRALYSEAQEKISQWEQDIEVLEDSPYLDKAQGYAIMGNASSLKAAIAQARRIGRGRVLYREAQEKIRQWKIQLEVIEDRPYLTRAEMFAMAGDPRSLKKAIAQAGQIVPGRTLYQEAREKIARWTDRMQRLEDRPILDRARNLAARDQMEAAIRTAEKIQPGRALYDEASQEIRSWQTQLLATKSLQQARKLAQTFTPQALASAIETADRVPNHSDLRGEADREISQWSQELLAMARDMSRYDMERAIGLVSKIPPSSSAYPAAKAQIAAWQKWINGDVKP